MSATTAGVECPAWCVSTHEDDHLMGAVFHEGRERIVATAEAITPGLTDHVIVRSEAYICESPDGCYPRSIRLDAINTYGKSDAPVLSLRQALRLAEELVQEVSSALAEVTASTVVTAATR